MCLGREADINIRGHIKGGEDFYQGKPLNSLNLKRFES